MVIDMFSYNIHKEADAKAFERACTRIEKGVPGIKKDKILEDVDGTLIQVYHTPDGKIKVVNDYEVDAVYAESDIDLKDII